MHKQTNGTAAWEQDASAYAPLDVLKRYFGYSAFRQNQQGIVDAILAGRDVLAVMPTGAGKSVCYQVPALIMDGMAVVVSPLISLMKDQVNALAQMGVSAAYLNSSLTPAQQAQVMERAAEGSYKLIYVAPERLLMESFVKLCEAHCPSMVAIDEAHCISQWGQDFRPSYTQITDFVEALPVRVPVAAFTATATAEVRADIQACLNLRNPYAVVSTFDRPNLRFEVRTPKSKDATLLAFCRARKDSCGIVYCTSRKNVEQVCDYLDQNGIAATRYHAGLMPEERQRNQDHFLHDRKSVMVATNAFGMGINKSNVAYVVHYNMPLDLESYYQEAGRAGRDGEPAVCVLMYAPKDVRTAEFLINAGFQENAQIDGPTRKVLADRARERLRQMTFYSTTQDCLRGFILRYFGEKAPALCENCSNCSTEFQVKDVTVDAQKIISCVYRLRERNRTMGRTMVVDILHGAKTQQIEAGGFATLSTYGIMANSSKKHIRFVLDRLIEEGVLELAEGDYPTVRFCAASGEFLRQKHSLRIKVPKERKRVAAEAGRGVKRPAAGTGGSYGGSGTEGTAEGALDAQLFAQLKELRAELAAEQNVPAYQVFSNHSLHDMCRKLPRTLDEFLDVSGVGQVKAQRYGQDFLACIARYVG